MLVTIHLPNQQPRSQDFFFEEEKTLAGAGHVTLQTSNYLTGREQN